MLSENAVTLIVATPYQPESKWLVNFPPFREYLLGG
jgi:hypothetical protein